LEDNPGNTSGLYQKELTMDSQFNQHLKKSGEYGVAYYVSHPIVFIEGLPKVKTHEVIMFETGQTGEVFAINRGKIEARVFSHEPVRVGTKVTRTDTLLAIPVGEELLGQTISPLGDPLDQSVKFTRPTNMRDLDAKPGGISTRQKITTHLSTGVSLIDLLIPLGRGQRELIIGDRKTGKTSLLMTTMKKQVYEGVVAIYAAIAKKKSDIKKLQQFFVQEKIMNKVIIVATSAYDSPSLIYQTPYAAMAVAEYFRDQGVHTLLILDDLSTHAKFYRELSLLARRFPGRDSYPGDVFYIHSKLLERAGNFKHPKVGEVSITCLPVIEIVEGDFTGYISTNVMGITDGHIYLDSNIYYQGMRPAVNIPLSVTRVGRQTLDKLSREVNKNLTAFLSHHTKLQNVSHFGQELAADVKQTLQTGELVYKFFIQPYQQTIPTRVQLVILSLILQNIIQSKEMLEKVKTGLLSAYYDRARQKLIYDTATAKDYDTFNKQVQANKDQLLALCGINVQTAAQSNTQGQPGQTPESQAQTSQTVQTNQQTPANGQIQPSQAQQIAAKPNDQTQTPLQQLPPTQPT
jgi:F-type H+/Na+-transporting ATPase subunit alpha